MNDYDKRRTITQWGIDLAIRNLVDGFDMAIGRHFSAPGFYEKQWNVSSRFPSRMTVIYLGNMPEVPVHLYYTSYSCLSVSSTSTDVTAKSYRGDDIYACNETLMILTGEARLFKMGNMRISLLYVLQLHESFMQNLRKNANKGAISKKYKN